MGKRDLDNGHWKRKTDELLLKYKVPLRDFRSADKMDVKARRMPEYDDKWWLRVTFKKTGHVWVPSFEDVARILAGFWWCEEEKYPTTDEYGLPTGLMGGDMVRRFYNELLK